MNNKLALYGGESIRKNILQYGFQTIDQSHKEAILNVLDGNKYLTCGPKVT